MLGTGSGTFNAAPGSPYTAGTNPIALVSADFDGDGITDLAVADSGTNKVSVLLGLGTGAFRSAFLGPVPVGNLPYTVLAADFNADGVMDLAAANSGAGTVTVLAGQRVATSAVTSTTSPSTVPAGQAVPLTLTVTPTSNAFDAPTGQASFSDGQQGLGNSSQTTSPYSFNATGLAPGLHTLYGTYLGDTRAIASSGNSLGITVSTASNLITFNALSNVNFGVAPFTISATASSGLTVTFSSNTTNVCTVSTTTVSLVNVGQCSITANQAGDSTYSAASPVTQTFNVFGGSQTITFDAIPNQILGISPFPIFAQATSLLPVTLSSQTAAVCKTTAAQVTLLARDVYNTGGSKR